MIFSDNSVIVNYTVNFLRHTVMVDVHDMQDPIAADIIAFDAARHYDNEHKMTVTAANSGKMLCFASGIWLRLRA